MARHLVKRGLDIPIEGAPDQTRIDDVGVGRVAVLGRNFYDLRARVQVEVGQPVRRGDLLVLDARHRGLRLVAPAGGTVLAIHRGERRRLLSVVIRIDHDADQTVKFASYTGRRVAELSDRDIRDLLLESGVWTGLRMRPFGRVPAPEAVPASIFVTAMATDPLAPSIGAVLAGREEDLNRGLEVLARLTEGKVYVCTAPDSGLAIRTDGQILHEEFQGPHPAGLPGTHIHMLDPVGPGREVWHLSVADVVAIGRLFASGELFVERVVSLAGPGVREPRLVRTRLGAALDPLVRDGLHPGEQRIIAGSPLSGQTAMGEASGFLGRYDQQITVLPEGGGAQQPAWMRLGFDVFTVTRAYMSAFTGRRSFRFDTSAHAEKRAMIPLDAFEDVMPLDILPTPLLRALGARDPVRSEALGCLELAEEDLALCSFVDPGKNDWGHALRRVLELIDKEG
jgi:Na+-transporting NADH:ubiquinone oxidoreductase subunit A